ncbi:polysaccharide deacetylase family protein [Streptomyces cavernicola]|uniref:Polysaccharide deacetylase family protein n=1 Tax=Streptomyces cavernicola TaxID=3043613 RepID=A0ABT6SNH0_9ACTN|nr:polysaccharide deacetylase family protein [Streptomyces sp. B-S-A6]MDI3409389.1 polysaccharide deacetylase family protein [Streptomyces sp. B-S-A6]
MRRRLLRNGTTAVSLLVLAAVTVSCEEAGKDAPQDGAGAAKSADELQGSRSATPGHQSRSPQPAKPPAPEKVGANELAAVPVLMYHQIVEKPSSVYDRTPEAFRAELERLAREKYVPVTAGDYAAGTMDIPAGTHPVVLTFDDSTDSQLRLGADGEPVDDCAVGILREVAREHPDFKARATFFVNGGAFSATGHKTALAWLHENGFEIGNHTRDHADLAGSGADGARRQIAEGQESILRDVPGAEVASLALPFGIQPAPASVALSGSAGGTAYENRGVYLVGAGPAPSPYAASFDPAGIPRIRSAPLKGQDAQYGSAHWLDQLADGAVARYTSDGDPDRVSYPKDTSAKPGKQPGGKLRPY